MVTDRLIALLKTQEGFREWPYKDTEGYWTVMHGHLLSTDKTLSYESACQLCNAPCDLDRADVMLRLDAESKWQGLQAVWPWVNNLPQLVQEGLIDMAFQMGVTGVTMFTEMRDALKQGDYGLAENCALNSVWARQTPSRANEVGGMIGNRQFPA